MTLAEKVKELWTTIRTGRSEGLHTPVAFKKSYTTNYESVSNRPMKSYLKVKIKSLAEEAMIIRHEERRVKRSLRWWSEFQTTTGEDSNTKNTIEHFEAELYGLHNHRTYDVRNESRAAQLAYAFIHGYRYDRVEDPTKTRKSVPTFRIADLVLKYGNLKLPSDIPYNKRRDEAEKIICSWTRGKTQYVVPGTNGQVLRPIQPQ